MKWQLDRGKGFLAITPPDSGFAQFLTWKKHQKDRIKYHIACIHVDMTNYCHCDPSIKDLRVYYNYDEDFDLMEPQHAFKREGKLWSDPQWKVLPSRLCSFIAHFTQLVPWRDMRQNFLFEDLLDHYDDGALCGTSMFSDRGAECSCLLQDLHHVETSIPVPLKHILSQRFTTQFLVQTLRKIDQLPRSTEASVRESTDPRIELIPGLQDVRKKTLPQMYFEDCSVFRGTYGRVNPLFQHPEDAVLLIWKPGDYGHVYFMSVSQSYPHHEQLRIHDWSMIVFSREMTGAIKRRVVDPPTQGVPPPNDDDLIHPDQHGDVPPNNDDNMLSGDEPEDPPFQSKRLLILDKMTILHQDLIQRLGQSEFKGNRDRSQLILQMLYQRQRPKLSSRGQRFNYQVMLNLFQFLLRNMMMKEKKDLHMILMPQVQMITQFHCRLLHRHMPGEFAQPAQQQSPQGTPELVSSQNDDDETQPYETDTPVLTEEEIAQLQEEDVDTEPYSSDHSHFADIGGIVFVPFGPKVQAAPDFGSYDVTGFNQFEQYLAKNGKKQPKAESVITQEVLRKYAKEIKQAKLEEFRSFLDFTAMTFRDKRRHKIDNYVAGQMGCLPSRLIRMDSSRSSRLDGYVGAFKML